MICSEKATLPKLAHRFNSFCIEVYTLYADTQSLSFIIAITLAIIHARSECVLTQRTDKRSGWTTCLLQASTLKKALREMRIGHIPNLKIAADARVARNSHAPGIVTVFGPDKKPV